MGQLICLRKISELPSNKFLFQINRYISKFLESNNISNINNSSNSDNINNYQKEKLNSENGKYKFIFYDISQNNTLMIEKKLDIIKSVEGLSELNFKESLYLCGNSKPEDNEGSFLFEINPFNAKAQILVHSIYGHYYPSLITFEDKYIFCIGGKNQICCECYNIEEKYWEPLPKLPEERYLCTLSLNSKNNTIYLFGGINYRKQNVDNNNKIYIENDYILKLKVEMYMNWEKIEIKNENEKKILKRFSAGSLVFDDQEDYIYILGGENEDNKYLDDIVKYNINSSHLCKINQKLKIPTLFMNQYSKKSQKNSYMHVFIDKFNNIINIDKHDFVEWSFYKI